MQKIILLTTTTINRGTTRKLAYVVKTADSKQNKEDIIGTGMIYEAAFLHK